MSSVDTTWRERERLKAEKALLPSATPGSQAEREAAHLQGTGAPWLSLNDQGVETKHTKQPVDLTQTPEQAKGRTRENKECV